MNEAIEIAKKYSTEESGGFVNGILDQINKRRSRDTSAGETKKPAPKKRIARLKGRIS
jgi:hypothetical protein